MTVERNQSHDIDRNHNDFFGKLLVIMLIYFISEPKNFPITCLNVSQQSNK